MDKIKQDIANPSQDLPDKLCLGVITSVHGVRGDIVAKSYTADPADIAAYGPLYDPDSGRSFDVKFIRLSKKGVVLRVKGISDRDSAEALRGTELYIDRALLPELIDEDEWYISDLIGLDVYLFSSQDEAVTQGKEEKFGIIRSVQNYGAGDLLEIELFVASEDDEAPGAKSQRDARRKGPQASTRDQTIFIPFLSEYVPEVSLPLRRVEIILPVEDDSLDPNRLPDETDPDQEA